MLRQVFVCPQAALRLGADLSIRQIGQGAAEIQRRIHGSCRCLCGGIRQILPYAGQIDRPGHRRKDRTGRRSPQGAPTLPCHGKVCRQVCILSLHARTMSRGVCHRRAMMLRRIVELIRCGATRVRAVLLQHHAQLHPLGRSLRRQAQQTRQQRFPLLCRNRRPGDQQQVHIAHLPAKAAHGQGPVQIHPRQPGAQRLPAQPGQCRQQPFRHGSSLLGSSRGLPRIRCSFTVQYTPGQHACIAEAFCSFAVHPLTHACPG